MFQTKFISYDLQKCNLFFYIDLESSDLIKLLLVLVFLRFFVFPIHTLRHLVNHDNLIHLFKFLQFLLNFLTYVHCL